jgi:hypothetical protein
VLSGLNSTWRSLSDSTRSAMPIVSGRRFFIVPLSDAYKSHPATATEAFSQPANRYSHEVRIQDAFPQEDACGAHFAIALRQTKPRPGTPRGWGWLTDPKKAAHNRGYKRTTFGLGDLLKWLFKK